MPITASTTNITITTLSCLKFNTNLRISYQDIVVLMNITFHLATFEASHHSIVFLLLD